jgi:UDP-glucose 4-epimerase
MIFSKKNILLTGYTGFVGSALIKSLPSDSLILAGRSTENRFHHVQLELDSNFNLENRLKDVEVVIHTAAITSVVFSDDNEALSHLLKVNTEATLSLAKQAAAAGVKRFIFLSSIKVNGESSELNFPITPLTPIAPEDLYGRSKAEAEIGLREIELTTDLEVVIIRPPLIYGPGVKGNFRAMFNLALKNYPLPMKSIANKRSLVSLDNLVDLICTCIEHPNAAGQTFLVSDDNDLSTTELLELIVAASGKSPRLLPFPTPILSFIAKILGKKNVANRLFGSLQLDISQTKEILGWIPPLTVEQGIKRCFTSFIGE